MQLERFFRAVFSQKDRLMQPEIIAETKLQPRVLAEVENIIQFNTLDAQETRPNGANGIIVCNPPYGVRLAEIQDLHALYPQLGSWLKQHYAGWTAGLLSGDMEMPKLMRLKPKRKIPLFNGNLDCRLFLFDMVAGSNRKE